MHDLIEFLERHVDGKTLRTPELVYELNDGALEGVYSDQISFSNLKYAQTGFQLDMFVVASEKIYRLDENRARIELRKDFSGVSLFRFEIARRKSSERLTGLFRCISASGKDVPAEAIVSAIYDVAFGNDELTLVEEQALYRDQPVEEDRFKPVAFHAQHRFYVEAGKLHFSYSGTSFDVDPTTLERHDSGDRFPSFVSVEI